jgi:hypothetical protein
VQGQPQGSVHEYVIDPRVAHSQSTPVQVGEGVCVTTKPEGVDELLVQVRRWPAHSLPGLLHVLVLHSVGQLAPSAALDGVLVCSVV